GRGSRRERAESPGHCPRVARCPAGPGHIVQQPRAPCLRSPRDPTTGTNSDRPIDHFRRALLTRGRGTSGPRLFLPANRICSPRPPRPHWALPQKPDVGPLVAPTHKKAHGYWAERAWRPCSKRAEELK
uniref:Uncharacterized protein n=1 Tax=Ictidomys tridecemlineatus TaxID=43179 RepID=A0A287D862_ICTTR